MTREELKLNDFEGFDRYLKSFETKKKTGWAVFYDEVYGIFTPPILKPETLPEYQLDHYAMWMVISVYELREKPPFCDAAYKPLRKCYACEWRCKKAKTRKTCNTGCPMVTNGCSVNAFDPTGYCVSGYMNWLSYHNIKESAYEVAYLPWRET